MDKIVSRSIAIAAPVASVWHALTTPAIMKDWLSDTEVIVTFDWEIGSAMTFEGKWHSKKYKDNGIIVTIDKERTFEYRYRSNFSKAPDKIENYACVRFDLSDTESGTLLHLTYSNIPSDAEYGHANYYWMLTLHRLKTIVEETYPAQ